MKFKTSEKGAAAVEFALVVPLLFLILFGIVEFGRAYNIQISLTQAARAAVRSMVVSNNPTTASAAANLNLSGITLPPIVYSPASCATGYTGPMTVTITYSMSAVGNLMPLILTGKASMQCGG